MELQKLKGLVEKEKDIYKEMWKKNRIYVRKCGKRLLSISRLKHKT
jgi:hypothetical protein